MIVPGMIAAGMNDRAGITAKHTSYARSQGDGPFVSVPLASRFVLGCFSATLVFAHCSLTRDQVRRSTGILIMQTFDDGKRRTTRSFTYLFCKILP